MFVIDVAKALESAKVPYAIVGGYAVALHGAVRGTVDLDLIIELSERSLTSAEKALKTIGLVSRLPLTAIDIFRFRAEYISKRNLVAWSFWNPSNPINQLDIIITHDVKKSKVDTISVQGMRLKVLSITSLIEMKHASGRPQDLEDIRALEELQHREK